MKKNIKLINSLNLSKNNIFNKYINNKYKLVPFTLKKPFEYYNNNKNYYSSDFKEWNNNIYYFNSNYAKNLPVYDLNINKLLKNYFDFFFNLNKFYKKKFLFTKFKILSLNKIFVSKAELKHTSSKVIITIYIFNRERIVLLKKLIKLIKPLLIIRIILLKYEGIFDKMSKNKDLNKKLKSIRKIKLKFDINNLKFKDIFLYKLSKLLSKFYKKKVEFNIINLKSFEFNSSIFTDILRKKLIHRNARLLKLLNFILNKVKKEKITIKNIEKIKDNINILENKYDNININSIVENINLNETIKNLYNIENNNNIKIIENSIKFKDIAGIRLELRGRLTKRYRADRSLSKLKIRGNLKRKFKINLDEKLPVIYRGNLKSNIEYSIGVSKRRIGAFAIKGWVAGE